MTSNRFRSVALALRGHITDTYDLLAAADAVVALDHEVQAPAAPATITIPHDTLVSTCRGSSLIMSYANNGQKVKAIVTLRDMYRADGGRVNALGEKGVSAVGLRAAKEAVEDARVSGF